ncbi:Hypothetical predicted protein [Cloeon dipterum]|uniref:Death domain-containing protein n=2 Tax=Cloeon dipterum TaxID=197152 RepID=A0A8S1CTT0_9INSE|nr:Hypothetical predicted protein [Cloeon dipterum]
MAHEADVCEKLFAHIRNADSPTAKQLLEQVRGVDLETHWPAGDPPLVLAAKHSRDPCLLTWLLAAKCDKDARSATGETALHCVVGHWDDPAEAVRVLISAGCSANLADQLRRQMPLHVLARRCSQSKKTSFGGASPSKLMPSLITSLEILAKVSDTNCEDHRRRTPLHILVKTNCSTSEPYLSLLTHGSQLDKQNERGETPLIEALENSSLFAAELLLEEAAKTQSDHQWLCRSTQYGETALHVAARKGLTNIVASILSLNSSASATMLQDLNGDSALHLAAGRGHLEVVEKLLSAKSVEVNCRNKKGLAPLHVAVESGFIHVVKALLTKPDCDILARTTDERRSSPVDLAQQEYRRRSQPEMTLILVQEAERRGTLMHAIG